MIDPKTLSAAYVGCRVIYYRPFCNREEGVLSSWNEQYVFVRFKGPTGEACLPEDLTFAEDYDGEP